jgi:hypothetical protein
MCVDKGTKATIARENQKLSILMNQLRVEHKKLVIAVILKLTLKKVRIAHSGIPSPIISIEVKDIKI